VRDFKKNRNMSTNSTNGGSPPPPISINITPNIGYIPGQPNVNSPTLPQIGNTGSNILAPNSKPVYVEQPQMQQQIQQQQPPKPGSSYGKEVRVGDEHKLVLEGVRLAMEIIEAKLPNHMGYAHLLLTRTLSLLADLANRCGRKEVA
jgi:hypothetical protein